MTNETIVYFYYVFLGQLQDEANHNFSVTGFLSKLAVSAPYVPSGVPLIIKHLVSAMICLD